MLFLAEAFTRPARLFGLAKLGFTQSYTYFTWRTAKWELTEFARASPSTPTTSRPNLFVNTPDILHETPAARRPRHVRDPRRAGRDDEPDLGRVLRLRAVRAPGRSRAGSEEYLDSEKYELRPARLRGGAGQRRVAGAVPDAAQRDPSRCTRRCSQLRTITFHHIDNDALLAYSKFDPITGDSVLVVVTLNAFGPEEATVWLDMAALGMESVRPVLGARRDHRRRIPVGPVELRPHRPGQGRRPHPEHAADPDTRSGSNLLRRE